MKNLVLVLMATLSMHSYADQQAASGKIEGVTASISTDHRAFKIEGFTPPCDTQYRWIKIVGTDQQRSEVWSVVLSAQARNADVEIRYEDTTCTLNTIFLW